jgi:hypothetical protein
MARPSCAALCTACGAAPKIVCMKQHPGRVRRARWRAGTPVEETRGARRHRFMESADINVAFRLLFDALRANVRRGMTCEGQTYAIEMDACVPGQLLGSVWLPPAAQGIGSPAQLYDARKRRALYDRLLAQARPESLFAYLCERSGGLYLEIVGEDGAFAALFPMAPGRGWRQRELQRAEHWRLDLRTLDASR